MSWDAKFEGWYKVGEYAFTVKVSQYDSNGILVGFITRDFQIILEEALPTIEMDDNVDLDINNRIYVAENKSFTLKAIMDANGVEGITMSAYSELTALNEVLEFNTYDSVTDAGKH